MRTKKEQSLKSSKAVKKMRYPLPDYPFKSNFVLIKGIRMHYIDEGDVDCPVVLFLHGVPTWSYTFRKLIPECVNAGNRIIAPDLPGFGKSDKPINKASFSLEQLVDWIDEFIYKLELKNLFLFAHDWGAIIGLILAAKHPERFSGIIACNGMLPVIGQKVPFFFKFWRFFCRFSPVIPIGTIVDFACQRKLSRTEKIGYNFPFLNSKQKNAIRVLPGLLPLNKEDIGADLIIESWELLEKLEKPFLTIFSNNDLITKNGEKLLQQCIPGARNQPHRILQGKHFLQEDSPVELSQMIIEFVKYNK